MNLIRRTAVLAALSGVAVASLGATGSAIARPKAPAAAHHATKTKRPAAAAAGFLARSLIGKHHDHLDGSYVSGKKTIVYVNYGETADAILSMDAAHVAQAAAARATRYLEAHVKAYAGHSVATYDPGAFGKLLLVAEAQRVDVHSFGGLNLVNAVKATEGVRGAAPGEFQQNQKGTKPSFDYFSTVGQALAVLGLANSPHAADAPDAAAVSFLAAQQCGDGGYPTELESDPATACKAVKDVDSTGYAVQALLAARDHTAATLGLTWLKRAEHSGGGFGTPANANSTALAVQALIAGGKSATKPQKWLEKHQVGCTGRVARRGAVRYQGSYDAAALLATSQAAQALAGKPLARITKTGAAKAAPVLACTAKRK
ncbi:MAG TPA: hypothetical protein VME70_10820 [Mycobacteriales bacterium]|nr:hypothetical protein [Mycobacteriales bacterium]